MALANPYDGYKTIQIQTAKPGQLVLMLYDGAIRFCNAARKAIIEKDMSEAHRCLIRVQDIITELRVNLNMEQGGQIAHNLAQLYDFINTRLVEANLKKDESIILEAQDFIKDLRETWAKII